MADEDNFLNLLLKISHTKSINWNTFGLAVKRKKALEEVLSFLKVKHRIQYIHNTSTTHTHNVPYIHWNDTNANSRFVISVFLCLG